MNICRQFLNWRGRTLAALLLLCSFSSRVEADWRQFRGPGRRSAAVGADDRDGLLPITWGEKENIAWRIDLPGRGLSSPIVIGDQVVLTCNSGARQDRLHVLCLDARDGEREWERQFWATGQTRCHPKTSMAAPTPVSDGEHVFAFFSCNDVICLDLEGNVIWLRALNQDYPDASSSVGMASSPLLVGDMLVLQIENDSDSFAIGLDATTGQNRWKVGRPALVNWSTPVLFPRPQQGGRNLIVLQSTKKLSGLDPRTGYELWAYEESCQGIPSTTVADGILYLPSKGLTALKLDGVGGNPSVLWQSEKLRVSTPSPVIYRDRIYVLSGTILKCASTRTGDVEWQIRLEGPFSSTPVAAGGHLYCFNEEGRCQVVQTEGDGKIVATSDLGEAILCTPAVSGGAMFVRSDGSIWKIARAAD